MQGIVLSARSSVGDRLRKPFGFVVEGLERSVFVEFASGLLILGGEIRQAKVVMDPYSETWGRFSEVLRLKCCGLGDGSGFKIVERNEVL